ncbi:MAG: DEDD exonuclease domain-containing protein [Ilumatobacteraceae bacterium]
MVVSVAGAMHDSSETNDTSADDVASVALRDVEFCVLDLETTGGSSEFEAITEIGAVKYRGGEEIGRFATLVNPLRAIPPFITVLTGITDTMVAGAPTIDETLEPLLEFIGDSVLVAHNARFDVGFINAALVRAGRDRLSNRVLDTVGLARRLVGADVDNCKLATLAASLGLAHQPSHRAINDVLATGDLLHHLIERAAGFGVFDLDDFVAMAKIGRHPQAAKLKLTVDLPRGPGVYLFVDAQGDVLYVGKATNIRSRVRSYFGTGDTRRKIGSLLKLMDAVHFVATPDLLTAEVLELRMISKLRPRYNHAGTRSAKYCYVRLTLSEVWPRLVVTSRVPTVATKDLYLGPISTRSMARDVIDAIHSVVPLRQCTVRMGRNYRAPEDAPVCSAAQLGVAYCPCSGTADEAVYAEAVQRVVRVMTGDAQDVIEQLTAKMRKHSQAQRFEEAGDVLTRIDALETVLRRVQTARELVAAGSFSFEASEMAISYQIECGLLRATHVAGEMFEPVAPKLPRDLSEFFQPPSLGAASGSQQASVAPATVSASAMQAISAELIDEILCIARHARTSATSQQPVNAA